MSDISTRIHNAGDGHIAFERVQDCTPYVENATALHNEGHHGSSEMRHAARIPFVIVERYCNDHKITFAEFMGNREHVKRLLNDPSLSAFRIWKGAV